MSPKDSARNGSHLPAGSPAETPASHGQLLRDVLGFQFKLFLDGLRDVVLSPVSIAAALLGALTSRRNPGRYFYRLLKLGHRSDRWINLFNAHDEENVDRLSPDSFVRHAESIVLSEYRKKGAAPGATRKPAGQSPDTEGDSPP